MYWKQIINDYITAIGTGKGGKEILENEYNAILSMIENKPKAQEGYDYRLTKALKWELYELPQIKEEVTIEDKAMAYDILMGVSE